MRHVEYLRWPPPSALFALVALTSAMACGGGESHLTAEDDAGLTELRDSSVEVRDARAPAPSDGGAAEDDAAVSEIDGGFDCGACRAPNACETLTCGDACAYAVEPDGALCGELEICVTGACVARACGDGWRDPGATGEREGCDDGNVGDGDACAPDCSPSVLAISRDDSSDALASGGVTAVAESGTGALLFVWSERESPAPGETAFGVRAVRATVAGVLLDDAPLVLATGIPGTVAPRPVVAGLPAGWAVTWRGYGQLGDVALALVSADGAARRLSGVIPAEFDQRDPTISALPEGFVVGWLTAGPSAELSGIRARRFDDRGRPIGVTVIVTEGSLSAHPRVAGGESMWAVAWLDATAAPRIVARRYVGAAPSDPQPLEMSGAEGGSAPSVSSGPGGIVAAWRGTVGADRGRVFARVVGDAPTHAFGTGSDDTNVAAGSLDAALVVGYQSAGGAVVDTGPEGAVVPPEWAVLRSVLELGARDLGFSATSRGLWATWTRPATVASRSRVEGMLVPWD